MDIELDPTTFRPHHLFLKIDHSFGFQMSILQWNKKKFSCDPIPGHGLPLRGFRITLRHTQLGRTPLDEWSARRSDLYLTTLNTSKRQTSMAPAAFEPAIPASERPQTHASDCAAIGLFIRDILTKSNLRFLFIIPKEPKLRTTFVLPQVQIFSHTCNPPCHLA